MDDTIHDRETRPTASMSRRRVLRAGALGVAAGLVATTPARALAFPTIDRKSEEATMTDLAETTTTAGAIRPFRVHVPDEALVDLRRRLAATRWPHKETVTDASQGVQFAMMQALTRYWATAYEWRTVEATLNALPQFMTTIDGLDIHFIHVKSRHANALPLLITHGWPGSIVEMLGVVGPLTDPTAHGGTAADAFDVVIPSLPATASRPSRPRPAGIPAASPAPGRS